MLMFTFVSVCSVDSTGVVWITNHAKFRIVCLDTDVLNSALVLIHNAIACQTPSRTAQSSDLNMCCEGYSKGISEESADMPDLTKEQSM